MIAGRTFRRGALAFVFAVPALLAFEVENPGEPLARDEQEAKDILVRWMNAIGGANEVQSLQTAYIETKIDYGKGGPPMDLLIRAGDGCYRMEYKMRAFGILVQAFDGKLAWEYNEQLGFGFLAASDHQLNLSMSDFHAPIKVGRWYPRRKALPEETIDGRKLRPVMLIARDGHQEKWYFDPATGYRLRVEAPGQGDPVVYEFDDFRPVFGARLKEPYRYIRTQGKNRTIVTVQTILYNEAMDPLLFSPPLAPREDNARLETLLRLNSAVSGAAELAKIGTRVTEEVVRVTSSGVEMQTKIYQKRPNLMVVEQTSPGVGRTWRGYDGKVGWAWSELEGYREMSGAELEQMLASTDLDSPMKLREQCPLRRFLDEKVVGGRELIGVAMASLRGPEGVFYFDRRSGELVQLETQVQAGADGQMKVVADFSDYRRVDGVLIPFSTAITNPAMQMTTVVKSVRHNVPLEDDFFRPRKEP